MPRKNPLRELRIGIGDIVFSTVSDEPRLKLGLHTRHKQFVSNAPADIILRLRHENNPNRKLGKKIFSPGGNWSLYQNNGNLTLYFRPIPSTAFAYQKVVLGSGFRHGDIYLKKNISSSLTTIVPFHYPLDELLMINLLSLGRGIMTHACGIKAGAQGFLFPGRSGAGKSTMAGLWNGRSDVGILSDDRIIIRKIDNRFRIYGTPWQGIAEFASPQKAPLEKIFFIKHAKKNVARKLDPLEAASSMIVNCFPPFWSKKGMEFTLRFCAELTQEIPCYELGFVPDKNVVDFIRRRI